MEYKSRVLLTNSDDNLGSAHHIKKIEIVDSCSSGAGDYFNYQFLSPDNSLSSSSLHTASQGSMADFSSGVVSQSSAKSRSACNEAAGDAYVDKDVYICNSASSSACPSLISDHLTPPSSIAIDDSGNRQELLGQMDFPNLHKLEGEASHLPSQMSLEQPSSPGVSEFKPTNIKTLRQLFESQDPQPNSEWVPPSRPPVSPTGVTAVDTKATQTEDMVCRNEGIQLEGKGSVPKSSQTSPQCSEAITVCKEWTLHRTAGEIALTDRAIQTLYQQQYYPPAFTMPFGRPANRKQVFANRLSAVVTGTTPQKVSRAIKGRSSQYTAAVEKFRYPDAPDQRSQIPQSARREVGDGVTDESYVTTHNASISPTLSHLSTKGSLAEQLKKFEQLDKPISVRVENTQPIRECNVAAPSIEGGAMRCPVQQADGVGSMTSITEPHPIAKMFEYWHSKQQRNEPDTSSEAGAPDRLPANQLMHCESNRPSYRSATLAVDRHNSTGSSRWDIVKTRVAPTATNKNPRKRRNFTVKSRPRSGDTSGMSTQSYLTFGSTTPNTTFTTEPSRYVESDCSTSSTAVKYESLPPTNKMVKLWSKVIDAHQKEADKHNSAIYGGLSQRKSKVNKSPTKTRRRRGERRLDGQRWREISPDGAATESVGDEKYPLKNVKGSTDVVKRRTAVDTVLRKPIVISKKSKPGSPRLHGDHTKYGEVKDRKSSDKAKAEESIKEGNRVRRSLPKISRSSSHINQMENILTSIKTSATAQPDLIERVNECLRSGKIRRTAAVSRVDTQSDAEDKISAEDGLISEANLGSKEDMTETEGEPIVPPLQLQSSSESSICPLLSVKQEVDYVPVKETEIIPTRSAAQNLFAGQSRSRKRDNTSSQDRQSDNSDQKSVDIPSYSVQTPGKADQTNMVTATPKTVSKLGVKVLPTNVSSAMTSPKIASVPQACRATTDKTSIVRPSVIKANVKAQLEFVHKITDPNNVDGKKMYETSEDSRGSSTPSVCNLRSAKRPVQCDSRQDSPSLTNLLAPRHQPHATCTMSADMLREAGSSVYSIESTHNADELNVLPIKPPRRKHKTTSSSTVGGPDTSSTSMRRFRYEHIIPPTSTASEAASGPDSPFDCRPKRTSTRRQSRRTAGLPQYERCHHCGSIPSSTVPRGNPSYSGRWSPRSIPRENSQTTGKVSIKTADRSNQCSSCNSYSQKQRQEFNAPHIDLWVERQANTGYNSNNSATPSEQTSTVGSEATQDCGNETRSANQQSKPVTLGVAERVRPNRRASASQHSTPSHHSTRSNYSNVRNKLNLCNCA